MDQQPQLGRPAAKVAQRIERHGLRVRDAALLIVFIWVICVVVFGLIVHWVDPETFDSVWLGMWWGLQTVTTVGYGDVVPGDTAGKLIGTVLMLGGLSLLAVITGAITSAFVTRAQEERRRAGHDPVAARLDELSAQLEEIRAELAAKR